MAFCVLITRELLSAFKRKHPSFRFGAVLGTWAPTHRFPCLWPNVYIYLHMGYMFSSRVLLLLGRHLSKGSVSFRPSSWSPLISNPKVD